MGNIGGFGADKSQPPCVGQCLIKPVAQKQGKPVNQLGIQHLLVACRHGLGSYNQKIDYQDSRQLNLDDFAFESEVFSVRFELKVRDLTGTIYP